MIKQYLAGTSTSGSRDEFFRQQWKAHWQEHDGRPLGFAQDEIFPHLQSMLGAGDVVLEAGCGRGRYVRYFTRPGYRMIGVDYEEQAILNIKKLAPLSSVAVADVRFLPCKDSSISLYVSLGVIEHYEEGPTPILAEAKRVLRPGGKIFLTVPFASWPLRLETALQSLVGGNTHEEKTFWQYCFAREEIVNLLRTHGFVILGVKYVSRMKGFYDRFDTVRRAIGLGSVRRRKLPLTVARYTLLPLLRPFAHMILVIGQLPPGSHH